MSHNRHVFIIIFLGFLFSGCSSFVANSSGSTKEDYTTRTLGTVVEDNTIESKTKAKLGKTSETLRLANIEVYSFNRVVLLTGQVPDAKTKVLAGEIAAKVRHVKRLHNELEIAQNNTFSNNMHDTYLKTKVVTRLIATKGIDSDRFEKIVTNGKLYLMGLVTLQEAAAIVNAAKQVSGLKQIVKVFEYIEPTAKEVNK